MTRRIRHIDFEVPNFGEADAGPTMRAGYRSRMLSLEPVAYWRLGEADGTVATDEVGDSDGVYTGGYTLAQPGALAWDDDAAAAFDGDDGHVALGTIGPGHPLQLAGTDISFATWFRQLAGDRYQRFFDKSSAGLGGNGYAFWADPVDRTLALHVDGNYYRAGDYTLDAWHFAVFIVTADASEIYLDGQALSGTWLIGSPQHAPEVTTGARLGTWNHSTQREWRGRLDEAALWDRVLTPGEIEILYQTGADR